MKKQDKHLTDEQIIWSIAENGIVPDKERHLTDCNQCRQKKDRLIQELAGFASTLHDLTPTMTPPPLQIQSAAGKRKFGWWTGISPSWQAVAASLVIAIAGYMSFMLQNKSAQQSEYLYMASIEFLFEDLSSQDASLPYSYISTFNDNGDASNINEMMEFLSPDGNGWQPAS